MKASLEIQPKSTLTLVDNATGTFVPVAKQANGEFNFFAAKQKLNALQSKASLTEKAGPDSGEVTLARLSLAKNEKQVAEHKAKLTALRKKFNQAKTPAEKKQIKQTYLEARGKYWQALEARESAELKLEDQLKAHAKKPAYETGSHVAYAFGKKPRFDGKPAGLSLAVKPLPSVAPKLAALPKLAKAAVKTPVTMAAAKTTPVKPSPALKPKLALATNPKSIITPKPAPVKTPAVPGESAANPIEYTSLVDHPDGKIKVLLKSGNLMEIDPKKDKLVATPQPGVSAVRLGTGKLIYFRKVEDTPPTGETAEAAKPTPLPVATSTPTPATTTDGSDVSDAEAADYTLAVPGYPIEDKFPVYIWKHKTEDKFLAVRDGKRVRLAMGNFLSIHRQFHPEFFTTP